MEKNGVKIKRNAKLETFVSAVFLILFFAILWAEPLVTTVNSEQIENQNNYIETTDSNYSEEACIGNNEVNVTKSIFSDFFQDINGFVYYLLALSVFCCFMLLFFQKKDLSLNFFGESQTAFMFWCFNLPLVVLVAIIAIMKSINKEATTYLAGKCVVLGGFFCIFVINCVWWIKHFKDLKENYSDSKVKFLNLCSQIVLIPLTFFWVVFRIESYKYLFAIGIVGYMWIQYCISKVDYYRLIDCESECDDRK